jgi:hypothetical protein
MSQGCRCHDSTKKQMPSTPTRSFLAQSRTTQSIPPTYLPQRTGLGHAERPLLRTDAEDAGAKSHVTGANRVHFDFSRIPIEPPMQAARYAGPHPGPSFARSEDMLATTALRQREFKTRQPRKEEKKPTPEKKPTAPEDKPAEGKTPTPKETAGACPTQSVKMYGAKCGADYGALGDYCYKGTKNWWFKEEVKSSPGPSCVPSGEIHQMSKPNPHTGDCGTDHIFNHNGPPSKIAPCTDTTFQTIFAGPTEAEVEKCKYENTQVIEVTVTKHDSKNKPVAGKVITTSGGKSTECDWTA